MKLSPRQALVAKMAADLLPENMPVEYEEMLILRAVRRADRICAIVEEYITEGENNGNLR